MRRAITTLTVVLALCLGLGAVGLGAAALGTAGSQRSDRTAGGGEIAARQPHPAQFVLTGARTAPAGDGSLDRGRHGASAPDAGGTETMQLQVVTDRPQPTASVTDPQLLDSVAIVLAAMLVVGALAGPWLIPAPAPATRRRR